eukprot:g44698.t1
MVIVQSLGFAIYRALDWGLDENEERELSQQLEQLIDQMANNDSEGSNGTADEGYSGQDDEEEGDIPLRSVKTFEQVMKACAAHLLNRNEADSHFQAVCRALFVETLELRTFLVKIKDAKEAPEAEYEVLLLQFVGGVVVTLEEAQDGHVTQGVGEGVKIVGDQKVLLFVVSRVQILYKTVSEPPLALTDIEVATSAAADAVDQVDRCAGEPLSNMERLLWALNG